MNLSATCIFVPCQTTKKFKDHPVLFKMALYVKYGKICIFPLPINKCSKGKLLRKAHILYHLLIVHLQRYEMVLL